MLVKISEDENHNKIVKPIAGATLGQGVPLGAWCSFEKDVAPSSNWLVAGTTFNPDTYPALAMYLGGNTIPERFDHSRLSEFETVTISKNSANPTIMPYDGCLIWCGGGVVSFYINDVYVAYLYWGGDSNFFQSTTINFNKGDRIYYTGGSNTPKIEARYYKHPMFIKATSIASDSDKDSILAQIQEYNTYSTEETLTGKTWLDGKPIYRKCTKIITNSALAPNITFSGSDRYHYTAGYTNNAETITSVVGVEERTNGNNQTIISGSSNLYVVLVSTTELAFSDFTNAKELTIILEYTKTTD